VDVPVHQAVLIQVLLFVLPKIVEQGLVIHVYGHEHAVADPFGYSGIGLQGPWLVGRLTRRNPLAPSLVTVSFFHCA